MRHPRFIPEPWTLVDITDQTFQGRYLLRPSLELKLITIGILARARRRFPIKLHAFSFLSTHYHLLISVRDVRAMSRFMQYLKSNLAREAGRLHGWTSRFWNGRYRHRVVSSEEAAQVARLRYILAQGCKEGLVASPLDWPGAHAAAALLRNGRLEGLWFDRTREYAASRTQREVDPAEFTEEEVLQLDPLPCWEHLGPEQARGHFAAIVEEIEQATRAQHRATGTQPTGLRAVLRRDPHERPEDLERSPVPRFFCRCPQVGRRLEEALEHFLAAYRRASARFRSGDLTVAFPANCFRPPPPFVECELASPAGTG